MNFPFIKKENRERFEKIAALRTEDGFPAMKPAHMQVIAYVGSFGRECGCYASNMIINQNSTNFKSPKSLRRIMSYLLEIGVLSKKQEGSRRVLRIEEPKCFTVQSQRDFRTEKGMPQYAYATSTKQGEIDPLFFAEHGDKFTPTPGVNLTPVRGEFDPILPPVLCSTIKNDYELSPLSPRSQNSEQVQEDEVLAFVQEDGWLASQAQGAVKTRPPGEEPTAPRNTGDSFLISIPRERIESEAPLVTAKRAKHPKNAKERMLLAAKQHAQGHIVSPLGMTDNRPKTLNPKLARDIEATGAVTIPQLYKHLVKLFSEAFGSDEIINMLPNEKSAMGSFFDEIRQKFIETCGHDATNRDIADYFGWFLEPKRLSGVLAAAKYGEGKRGGAGLIHFKQMVGGVYVRRFYEEKLKNRQRPEEKIEMPSDKTKSLIEFYDKVYAEYTETEQNQVKFCTKMLKYGFALAAQFLHDERKMDEKQIEQRIIDALREFVRAMPDKAHALELIVSGVEVTRMNKVVLDEQCVWYDFEPKLKTLLETLELDGKEHERNAPSPEEA